MEEIRWSRGPHELRLGETWALPLPEGILFAEDAEMRRFLSATGNILTGHELAVFGAADLSWFVIVSVAKHAAGPEVEWTEESREEDGRQVVIHSMLRNRLLFELVTERPSAATARQRVDRVLTGMHEQSTSRPPWWPLLVLPLVLLYAIRRRRAWISSKLS